MWLKLHPPTYSMQQFQHCKSNSLAPVQYSRRSTIDTILFLMASCNACGDSSDRKPSGHSQSTMVKSFMLRLDLMVSRRLRQLTGRRQQLWRVCHYCHLREGKNSKVSRYIGPQTDRACPLRSLPWTMPPPSKPHAVSWFHLALGTMTPRSCHTQAVLKLSCTRPYSTVVSNQYWLIHSRPGHRSWDKFPPHSTLIPFRSCYKFPWSRRARYMQILNQARNAIPTIHHSNTYKVQPGRHSTGQWYMVPFGDSVNREWSSGV